MANSDRARLRRELAAMERKAKRKLLNDGLRRGCEAVAAEVRRTIARDSGATAATVHVVASSPERKVQTAAVVVGDKHSKPVAFWLEFGTSRMAPRPTLRPAAIEQSPRIVADVGKVARSIGG